jgi:hypothetical protein
VLLASCRSRLSEELFAVLMKVWVMVPRTVRLLWLTRILQISHWSLSPRKQTGQDVSQPGGPLFASLVDLLTGPEEEGEKDSCDARFRDSWALSPIFGL